MKILLYILISLCLLQIILAIPFTFRLLVETVNQIELRLQFGITVPFDWNYVRHGKSLVS